MFQYFRNSFQSGLYHLITPCSSIVQHSDASIPACTHPEHRKCHTSIHSSRRRSTSGHYPGLVPGFLPLTFSITPFTPMPRGTAGHRCALRGRFVFHLHKVIAFTWGTGPHYLRYNSFTDCTFPIDVDDDGVILVFTLTVREYLTRFIGVFVGFRFLVLPGVSPDINDKHTFGV